MSRRTKNEQHRDGTAKLVAVVLGVALCLPLGVSLPIAVAQSGPTPAIDEGIELGLREDRPGPSCACDACDKIAICDQSSGAEAPAMRKVSQKTAAPMPGPTAKPEKTAVTAASTSEPPGPKRVGTVASGWKSARVTWYGPGLYGRRTASGLVLQPTSMIVAHRTLPFGTRIEFEYGGRRCIATVADRGPCTAGLEFDLGPGTAKALGFSGVGTVRYRFVK